jgi:hypothetical protein
MKTLQSEGRNPFLLVPLRPSGPLHSRDYGRQVKRSDVLIHLT